MTQWILSYVAILLSLVLLDVGWITLVARRLYEVEASDVIREKPKVFPGILFYLIYAGGVLAFAVWPMTTHLNGIHAVLDSYVEVAAWGAGLGLFAYSTFSLTNQAIIKQWKYKLAITDLLWGSLLTATVSLVGFAVFRAFA